MRIRVDYFVDDDQVKDYLALAGEIRSFLRLSSDYQHGDITLSTNVVGISKEIDIAFYLRDCEHMANTRDAMRRLTDCLVEKCT